MQAWSVPPLPRLAGRGLPVRVWDSATGELRPIATGPVATLYVCGITPYDATHLGHAATYLTFDTLLRALTDAGHQVNYVQNLTDVDDPLFERAAATGQDWRELAARETELFRADMSALSVVPPRTYAAVSETVPLVVQMVTTLLEAGAGYELNGDIYASVAADPHFGEVSSYDRARMLALFAERGGDPDRAGKKDPLDALLWRAQRPGEPSWPAPFGPGRPGWHVECAAIATHYLGDQVDVNGGGADLLFPHHEHTASHARLATGCRPYARHHVHQAMVGWRGHKMSKSRGNLVLVSELRRQGADPRAVRLALLAHSYRRDWEWTEQDLPAAADRLHRWERAVQAPVGPPAGPLLAELRAAVADDLDTPRALAAVDRWAARASQHRDTDPTGPTAAAAAISALLGVAL